MPYQKREDALFTWISRARGGAWGDTLDAGTGDHSLSWLADQPTRSLTALTVEAWRMPSLQQIAPQARILLGQWTDPALLAGEGFDTVIVDYVIGAIDGHAPYFQYDFLRRLRPHCRDRVYVVGLEPQPRDGSPLDEVCRIRDAAILLAGHRCYREYPREKVEAWLEASGYVVEDEQIFPNLLGARFINGQLDVARRKLPLFKNPVLADAFGAEIEAVRARASAKGERQQWGEDYVIAARVK